MMPPELTNFQLAVIVIVFGVVLIGLWGWFVVRGIKMNKTYKELQTRLRQTQEELLRLKSRYEPD